MMKTSWFALIAILPLGCGHVPEYPPDSPYYAYPGGARLTLNRTIEIPPDSATVRLQFGRPVARNGVHEEEPYCIFELETVSPTIQRVEPDRLTVTSIERRVRTFAGLPYWPTHHGLRRHAVPWRVGFADDDGPSQLYFITEFRLKSDQQPNVRALACQHNQMMPGVAIMRHLTLPEIRGALGGWFTLDVGYY